MEIECMQQEEEPPDQPYSTVVLEPTLHHENVTRKESTFSKDWPEITNQQWNDWRWQDANSLRTLFDLTVLLKLTPYQAAKYKKLIEIFHYSITPYYLSLIDWNDPLDPIKMQCVPDLKELDFQLVGDNDPLEEGEDTQVPGLVHRYPDRVLAIVTNNCSMYCRHCTRKRIWCESESVKTKEELTVMINYIRSAPAIREVIVSGGDPLTLNIERLDWFLGELRMITHVEVIRIGTRIPVVMPMRITDDLVKMLASHRPIWLNTQFNHPKEITPDSSAACDRILTAGIPISNQSVLLRGINDSVDIMRELCHSLQKIMVRPYYLFQCDPVKGVEHFRTSLWKGIEIIEMMRGYTGGLCVPTFVIDAPGGGGKIPLQPYYLCSVTEKDVLLRNYEGMIIKYFNPQEADFGRARKTKGNGKEGGTAQLIKGNKKVLVPEESARYKRRRGKISSTLERDNK